LRDTMKLQMIFYISLSFYTTHLRNINLITSFWKLFQFGPFANHSQFTMLIEPTWQFFC